MDRLIDDYEKALTVESIRHDEMEAYRETMESLEALVWFDVIADDSKLPQWKAQYSVKQLLRADSVYRQACVNHNQAERNYRTAKIRLAVITERLKLTRARLYGGHYEMLDLQEVEQVDYETLA